jgi:hypothetical protein
MAEQDEGEGGAILILILAAVFAGMLTGYSWGLNAHLLPAPLSDTKDYAWAVGIAASMLYPLLGSIATLMLCGPLCDWATGEDTPFSVKLLMVALWPLSIPLCIMVFPAVGLTRRR